ncbi:MAG TPA: histidinol dehydrogenase, partial [Thermoanaerobaculia bacterium]
MPSLKVPSPEADAALRALEARRNDANEEAFRVADAMIAGIRARGDAFAAEQIARFDRVSIAPADVLIKPRNVTIDRDLAAALDLAIARVEAFHLQQLPASYAWEGVVHRVRPLQRVGVYAPG